MLVELSIRNLAVIEHVQLTFANGFHVLTGETGAGKSIIIDALSLVAGSRGSSDLVRYGCEKAEIEAMFQLEDKHPVWEAMEQLGIDADRDEPIVIRREINSQGKSSSRINGQLVNLTMLREAGEWLVNIHGQHEHQSLLKVEQHIEWLDLFGGEHLNQALADYREVFERYDETLKERNRLLENSQQTLRMIDLYRFQADEIAAAELKIDEEELLTEEKRKLANAEKLFEAVSKAYESLFGNGMGLDLIGKAMNRMEEAAKYDRRLQPMLEQIQSAFYQLEDAAFQLRDRQDEVEFNPERLEQIERRLDTVSSLKRKYGSTIKDILEHFAHIQKELDLTEHKDERLKHLEDALQRDFRILIDRASTLSALRKEAAENLSLQIERELCDLQMERTRFQAHIERREISGGWEVDGVSVKFTEHGWDHVEFLISANPGEPLRPLHKIASGGELSRIMLAMKTIFAGLDQIPVLIFDEVDTGVSGRAAQAIAEKLSNLSGSCQVFSITHLPQVACMADAHYLIQKKTDGERTYTRVKNLDRQERVRELARMLGGVEITETTLEHAKEMLEMANQKKSD
ncbi:DNA repair protein RecN [Ferviditalea candida]|uniref:DNA repair protein RecN n=1 Tax=Ferviditalea candida TaxID=3108399 RepID=A0ABU5ZG10_9BACL|nr:DNA repair protein RecN [Paenibacillaceae bacterium T2]